MDEEDFPFNMMTIIPHKKDNSDITKQKNYPNEIIDVVKKGIHEDVLGKTFSATISNERYAVIHIPATINPESKEKYPMLLFFHGLGSWAWCCALQKTKWR